MFIHIYTHRHRRRIRDDIYVLGMTREKELVHARLYDVCERDRVRKKTHYDVCPIYVCVCCTSRQRMIGGGEGRGVCTGGPDDKSYCVNSSPPPSADRCRSWTRGVGVKHCCSRHRSCPRVLYIIESSNVQHWGLPTTTTARRAHYCPRAPFSGAFRILQRSGRDGIRGNNIKI